MGYNEAARAGEGEGAEGRGSGVAVSAGVSGDMIPCDDTVLDLYRQAVLDLIASIRLSQRQGAALLELRSLNTLCLVLFGPEFPVAAFPSPQQRVAPVPHLLDMDRVLQEADYHMKTKSHPFFTSDPALWLELERDYDVVIPAFPSQDVMSSTSFLFGEGGVSQFGVACVQALHALYIKLDGPMLTDECPDFETSREILASISEPPTDS
eukprot:TRINITY_DN11858_c0_g1_i3.p1 TRINITY_DN11858_c0_g1~~TRINITY_DN11858_c0_g1_i3.p1  ORF type:complete len:209 (-),score=24.92 TRINITY_DN11858_c0_g1_i3:41-667(-)